MNQIILLLSIATIVLSYDPKFSDWGSWSSPSISCGNEPQVIFRTRTCLNNRCLAKDLVEKRTISLPLCPINGGWSDWSDWSLPSETCGFHGLVFQTRDCNNPFPQNGGEGCQGNAENSKEILQPECTTPAPIINGEWSDWSAWSSASKSCCTAGSSETLFRTRSCDNPEPSDNGITCVGQSKEIKTVLIPKCAINGGFGEWSQWSLPGVDCSDVAVFVRRHRDCNRPTPSNGGLPCQGESDQNKIADLPTCPTPPPIIDGVWTSWSAWSRVSKSCCNNGGSETLFRTRTCDNPQPSDGGRQCDGVDYETKVVQIPRCQTYGTTKAYGVVKSNGVWGPWTDWTSVMQSCSEAGFVVVTRTRVCVFATGGVKGYDCVGESLQSKSVAVPVCIITGDWNQWSAWSVPLMSCSSSGKAVVERTRICEFPVGATDTIVPCEGESLQRKTVVIPLCSYQQAGYQTAGYQPAAADGFWGAWSAWSLPSETCVVSDVIRVTRTRQCLYTPKRPHGNACVGSSIETKDADLPICVTPAPILDGVWSEWVEEYPSATCSPLGYVIVHRTRVCLAPTPDANAFTPCVGPDRDQRQQPVPFCRVVGVWDQWTAYSSPAFTCDDSRQTIVTRTRRCIFSGNGDSLVPCVGFAQEGKLVILPRCSIAPAPIEALSGYNRATAPAPIEDTTTVKYYRPTYQTKTTPSQIEETTTVKSYNKPVYQTKTTPSQIVDTTTVQSYKPQYQYRSTPPNIEDTTTVKSYKTQYQTKLTPPPIVDTTAYQGYKTAPAIIETTVYQGYKAPKTAPAIIETTAYQPKRTAPPIIETTTATGYDDDDYYEEK